MISVSLSVRNLLVMSSVFSLFGGVALLITNVLLLDGLRKEQETAFKGWLYSMGFFAPWKWLAWAFAGIVNDMIFAYNIIMLIAWFFFNILNVFSFLCIYSLYLELSDLTKLQDLARLKVCLLFCILIPTKKDWNWKFYPIFMLPSLMLSLSVLDHDRLASCQINSSIYRL